MSGRPSTVRTVVARCGDRLTRVNFRIVHSRILIGKVWRIETQGDKGRAEERTVSVSGYIGDRK